MLPLELRTPSSPMIPAGNEEWAALTEELETAAEELGIPFSPPPLVPWTRKAHEMTLHALEVEDAAPIYDLLFDAYFHEGLDLGRVDVLVELAERAGLDPPELRTVLGVDRFRPEVEARRDEARKLGVRGVPTLLGAKGRMEGFIGTEGLWHFLREEGLITG